MSLTRPFGCAGSSEPSLVVCAKLPLSHELASFIDKFISWFVRLCVRVRIHGNHS